MQQCSGRGWRGGAAAVALMGMVLGGAGAWAQAGGGEPAGQTVSGTVRSLDVANRKLTLEDGTSFEVGKSATLAMVGEGQPVRVRFHMEGDRRVAEVIEVPEAVEQAETPSQPESGWTGSKAQDRQVEPGIDAKSGPPEVVR